jgi:hypothetical protein
MVRDRLRVWSLGSGRWPGAIALVAGALGCGSHSSDVLPECVNAPDPPAALECTGLYTNLTNLANDEVSPSAVSYAPAVPLWADGADKQRWISIPDGQTIDRSDPNEWTFPVGTKVWKEFSYNGTRVETRYFEKQTATPSYWVYTTYLWSADGTSATQSFGGDIPFPGDFDNTYHVPTPDECNSCHKGRSDRLLGFEEVSLGLPAATGLTLAQLAQNGTLSPPPTSTSLEIGDDGTGLAAAPLSWLHINCGTTCHNRNQDAMAYGAGMYLRLDPTTLDGSASTDFDPRATTVDVRASSPSFNGAYRIAPGDPTDSVLMQLISIRGPTDQMPPIASRVVDTTDMAVVQAWIQKMPGATKPPMDAGTHDASKDGPEDAREDARDAGEDARDAGDDARDATMADAHEEDAHDGGGDAMDAGEAGEVKDAGVEAEN